MGELELYFIYEVGGVWEDHWRELQGAIDLPVISKADAEHALRGWTKPLADQIGPAPKGRLLLLPDEARRCANRKSCPLFDAKHCGLLKKNMPWCFEPDGYEARVLAAELVQLWRSEVYVLVVRE